MEEYKNNATVDVAPYNPAGQVHPPQQPAAPSYNAAVPKKNSRAYRDISFAFLVICFPMVVLSGLLLGLVYSKRVKEAEESPSTLQLPNAVQNDASAYLVDYSATRLITIASWTSTVAPFLPGFVMVLLSFPAARRMLKTSNAGRGQNLPTPYQIGLYLHLLTASRGALWQCMKYKGWKKREKSVSVITKLVIGLVLSTFLGYLILAADTWLHVATSTVILHRAHPIAGGEAKHSYGRGFFSDRCSQAAEKDGLSVACTIDIGRTEFLTGAEEAYATLNNLSTQNQLSMFAHEGDNYAALLPANIPSNLDFRASSFAVSTQCQPVSKACNLTAAYGASTPFHCTDNFYGDATALKDDTGSRWASSNIGFVLLEDADATKNITLKAKDMNPFYLGTWALEDTVGIAPGANASQQRISLANDPEIVTTVHGGFAWVLRCQTTVHDLVYSYVNGSITAPKLTIANATTGGLMAATHNFALLNLETASRIARFSSSAQELADKWGDQWSHITLGLSAGVMTPRPNILEQTRTQQLVARVPKAPLYALVGLNLVYAGLGVVLAAYALLFSRIGDGTGAARQRLTIHGVVAECFEQPGRAPLGGNKVEEFFEEREGRGISGRLGVREDPGGGMRFFRM